MALDDASILTLNGVSCVYRIAPTYDTSDNFADIPGVEGLLELANALFAPAQEED